VRDLCKKVPMTGDQTTAARHVHFLSIDVFFEPTNRFLGSKNVSTISKPALDIIPADAKFSSCRSI